MTENKEIAIEEHPLYCDINFSSMHQLKGRSYRSCERDGNCLYKTFSMLIYKHIKNPNFRTLFFSFSKKIELNSSVYEWYIESIEEIISEKEIDELNKEDWLVFVSYLRLVCSAEAQVEKEKYQHFIDEDIKKYCNTNIDPMGQRAGDFEIAVLSSALNLETTVFIVIGTELKKVNYNEGNIKLEILHTPDHFEPLY